MITRLARLLPVAGQLLVVCGCAEVVRIPTVDPRVEAARCLLSESSSTTLPEIRVAGGGAVRFEDAPVPDAEAEAVAFRHVFETLVGMSCTGLPEPGLALRWHHDHEGRIWEFQIRPGATWSDGSAVSAGHIASGWRESRVLHPHAAPWLWLDPDSAEATPAGSLRVTLRAGIGPRPAFFAHPALAAIRRSPRSPPQGTGTYRWLAAGSDGETVLASIPGTAAPRLRFTAASAQAEIYRALEDSGAVVLLRGGSVDAYADRVPGRTTLDPEWRRDVLAYSTLAEPAVRDLADALHARVGSSLRFGSRLPPSEGGRSCPGPGAAAPSLSPSTDRAAIRRIRVSSDDPVALRIAEELTALLRERTVPRDSSWGSHDTMAGLRGPDVAFVAPGGRQGPPRPDEVELVASLARFSDACLESAALAARGGTAHPLLPRADARSQSHRTLTLGTVAIHLSVPATLGGLVRDWDGVPLFHRAGPLRRNGATGDLP